MNKDNSLLDIAVEVYKLSSQKLDPINGYPQNISSGTQWTLSRARWWTSGFYAGILWYLYEYSQDNLLLKQAKRWTEGLEEQKNIASHDVGFLIFNSFGHGYNVTGIDRYKQISFEAAKTLADRFNKKVGAIKSWDAFTDRFSYPVIIDNMMNLMLLYWAAQNGGDLKYLDIARAHSMTTMRDHIRPDGSVYHVVDYIPDTGDIAWRGTVQGYSDHSTWARGQAWGLYGFTMAYRELQDREFMQTAIELSDHFIDRLPVDSIPYWDFDAPEIPNEPRDASAGAIAASGLLELSTLLVDTSLKEKYYNSAKEILDKLSSPNYFNSGMESQALLNHSTGNKPYNREVDMPIIYADYFFVEALIKLVQNS